MTNVEQVLRLIWDGVETMTVDYKRDFYKNLHASDFAKDIAAFANCAVEGDKWIIFGVDDKSRTITGIDPYSYLPLDSMDHFISVSIEPFVHIESELFQYEDNILAYIKICADNRDQPYVIKESCGKNSYIEKGDIYIRKGTCNLKAGRMDLDAMYEKKGNK